jgi:Ni/Fe-hydrogenase subunit HybB-like protein
MAMIPTTKRTGSDMNATLPKLSDIGPAIKACLPRTFWGYVSLALIGVGFIACFLRFWLGLGATTNLSDNFPWGLWIAFDFFGIGLSAAGFTVVAAVHLFHAERFEPIVRPAILTALIGYSLVVMVLVIDLGLPLHTYQIYRWWTHDSVMFEITWCLILYTTVLCLEIAPIVLEKFNITAPTKILRKISVPLMVFGVILSTLHQSSFGSLYLILPNRMHALWYSPILPILFFISCIAMGLSMIIFETLLIRRKGIELISDKQRGHLAKIVVTVLLIYLFTRFFDMWQLGGPRHGMAFEAMKTLTYHSAAFYTEILCFALPAALLMFSKVRNSRCGIHAGVIFVFLGFAANRMNTVVTSLEVPGVKEWTYFPSPIEILIALAIAAVGATAFVLISRYLPIFVDEHGDAPNTH